MGEVILVSVHREKIKSIVIIENDTLFATVGLRAAENKQFQNQ